MHNNYHKEPIEREQYREHRLDTIRRGLFVLVDSIVGRILGVAVAVLLTLGWVLRDAICAHLMPGPLMGLLVALYPLMYPVVAFTVLVLFLTALARPWYFDRVARDLIRAGVVNRAGEPPVLRRCTKNCGGRVWRFRSRGIPLKCWLDNQAEIESALNINVVEVREGKDKQTILLYTVPPDTALGDDIPWDDSETDEDEAVIVLGRGLLGAIKVNLDKAAHVLIGGSTGSGKSILLKVILRQALNHGHTVYIADFKGGIDYSREWHERCGIITSEQALLETLETVIAEIERRKQAFLRVEAKGIVAYRRLAGVDMRRVFIACDEVAELMDKGGADKARKELLGKIESALSTIARQGRAFGVHLVLATQRPDAGVLVGQIKNNMDVRICGRADATLSGIILGDGRAHEVIPKYAQGRFIMQDGTVFQGFNFDD